MLMAVFMKSSNMPRISAPEFGVVSFDMTRVNSGAG
jgi:hypothetical protein